ncbi:TIGR01906 family membrane protein [uncultured Gemella sp.]|uniref:TIGR01906 family membrane protein n=1 Tax=uncultured Gemella sp. TaxID=254352 RepID=UPI0028D56789|nr:TIGR01906 family membrane protein [uncultured Gemella sp.]
MNKYLRQTLIVIQNFSLFISAILGIIFYNCFNLNFYKNFYLRENLAPSINTTDDELINNTTNLLEYLTNKAELNTTWFSEKDILHMKDVRVLYNVSFNLMIFFIIIFILSTILIALVYKNYAMFYITKTFNKTLLAFILLVIVLAGIISYNFTSFWIKFHQLLFTNDLWLLSPEESNLIKMVPEQFFISLITTIILHILILFVSFLVVNNIFKKKFKIIST